MKKVADLVLSLVVGFAVLTLWSVLPPHIYFGLLGTGVVATIVSQNGGQDS